MEFLLELVLTISLPLLISFVVTKLFSRGSTDDELAPFGFDLQFRSPIRNPESGKPSAVVEDFVGGDEVVECQPKQGGSVDAAAVVEPGDGTESKCDGDAAAIDCGRIVEERVESDSGDCGGEVAENVLDESSVRARCDETDDRSQVSDEVKGEGRSAGEISVEDDDWEGIERTELERLFAATVECVKSHKSVEPSFGGELKMRLGGLHRIATEGPCREPPPMALKINARAKWNAWKQLGNMTPEMAMERYINLVAENIPSWKPKTTPVNNDQDVPCTDESEKIALETKPIEGEKAHSCDVQC